MYLYFEWQEITKKKRRFVTQLNPNLVCRYHPHHIVVLFIYLYIFLFVSCKILVVYYATVAKSKLNTGWVESEWSFRFERNKNTTFSFLFSLSLYPSLALTIYFSNWIIVRTKINENLFWNFFFLRKQIFRLRGGRWGFGEKKKKFLRFFSNKTLKTIFFCSFKIK